MNKRLFVAGIAAFAVSLGAIIARGAETEEQVSLDKVPAKVRATLKKHTEGAKIQKVEIVTTRVYDVEIRKGGKTTEFSVSSQGKYMGVKIDEDKDESTNEKKEVKDGKKEAVKKSEAKEDDDEKDEDKDEAKHEKKEVKGGKKEAVKKSKAKDEEDEKDDEKDEKASAADQGLPLNKAPKAVQATVKKLLGEGKLVKLAKEADGNYELDYQVEGVRQAAIITPGGEIEEKEVTVEVSTLPKAVTEAVKRLYPKGKITLAEKSTTKDGLVYELEVTVDKKSHTVTISPKGKVQ